MKTLVCLLFALAGFANAQNPAPPAPPKEAPWRLQGTSLNIPKKPEAGNVKKEVKKESMLDILCAAYCDNPIAADLKFKGQQFTISGVIEEIKTNGTVVLVLPKNASKIYDVYCQFTDAAVLPKLKSKQALIFLGTVKGMNYKTLVISDCSLPQ